MRFAILCVFGVLAACGASPTPSAPTPPPVPPAKAAPTSLQALSLTDLQGNPFDVSTLDGRVVLFVNVASNCGYTPQYKGLQALYQTHKDSGLTVVGVPCNQFGGQEPGSSQEIATFCETTYGVTFPLLQKQEVNGPNRSPLYQWLVNSQAGGQQDISWNFEKFLVGRKGQVLARFGSGVTPESKPLTTAIEQALAQ